MRLIGTLIPRYSRFLPRPPRSKNQEYYLSYQCFRLVCERLFGRATCYSVYSTEIPAREYKDPHLELVVTKVNNNLCMYLITIGNLDTLVSLIFLQFLVDYVKSWFFRYRNLPNIIHIFFLQNFFARKGCVLYTPMEFYAFFLTGKTLAIVV